MAVGSSKKIDHDYLRIIEICKTALLCNKNKYFSRRVACTVNTNIVKPLKFYTSISSTKWGEPP